MARSDKKKKNRVSEHAGYAERKHTDARHQFVVSPSCFIDNVANGRMPPVGEITEKTDEDSRSNRRPIELIGSPACQRSQISDRWAAE